jgi:hypothetical protein
MRVPVRVDAFTPDHILETTCFLGGHALLRRADEEDDLHRRPIHARLTRASARNERLALHGEADMSRTHLTASAAAIAGFASMAALVIVVLIAATAS